MTEQLSSRKRPKSRMSLFSSSQPSKHQPGRQIDTFHIFLHPPCEATSDKTFFPKTKEKPAGLLLGKTEEGKIEEIIFERNTIGWSSDREAALIKFARELALEHNYALDPTIESLPPGAATASSIQNNQLAPAQS